MCFNQDIIALIPTDERLSSQFLFWALKGRSQEILNEGIKPGVTVQSFYSGFFKQLAIPMPPLEVQKEIVAEIEGYQKVIDGARAVLDHYRPHIPIHPDWPRRELGTLAENMDSCRVPITKGDRKEGPFPYYGASGVVDHVADYIFDEGILLKPRHDFRDIYGE